MIDVLVIGAGASGLMAAITAARNGSSVLVLEQKEKIGKKLYATGNGKCNFTNDHMDKSCYHGNSALIDLALSTFSKEDTLSFFEGIGIAAKQRDGYYYPMSEQASAIVLALTDEANRLKVTFAFDTRVLEIKDLEIEGYQVVTSSGKSYEAHKLVIASGLLASPKLGSDGSLLPVLQNMGYEFTTLVPALCGFYCKGANFNKIAGVRVGGEVSVRVQGYEVAKDLGEIQFTDYGISGIPVFQVSRFIALALAKNDAVEVHISFLPELSEEELLIRFKEYLAIHQGECSYRNLLQGYLPEKLMDEILRKVHAGQDDYVYENDLPCLVREIKSFVVHPKRVRDYEFAQVCAGGLAASMVNEETLESKLHKGIYFAGEILDVDGICGGYNLQFAWATGNIAGRNASGV